MNTFRTAAILLLLASILFLFSHSANATPIAFACPHAPPPRLRVGMEAAVAPAIGQLNLRSLPAVDTGVENTLYYGNRLVVLSGPSCNGGYQWWRVETSNGRRGWVAEGTWELYYVIPARDYDAGRTPDPLFLCDKPGVRCPLP